MSSFSSQVYQIVAAIPRGQVMTYGQIAGFLKKPGAARAVGNALHKNPYPPEHIPCHRVVNAKGCLAPNFGFGGIKVHRQRLAEEGILIGKNYTIDLKKYQFQTES